MATLADSLVSSSARRLGIRVRPDLSARRHTYQGRAYWVVKEPVGLNYFRFQEEEFAILQMLDGYTSLDQLKERFEADFPPQKITVEELGQFVGMLHRSGLVIADAPGQGVQLKKRRDERRKKEMLGTLTNVLAIRFKGIDPERILTWLYPYVKWLFAPPVVAACCGMMIAALLLIAVQFDVFQSKLPAFHDFFAMENWFWMAIVLGVTKVIHEFGHGMSCKHFGGECHEMGVMILVLTPCLYCNVSDSWMLPNKWHRAMIGAAGMYIEVVLASFCTFIWWFTEPGLLNQLCLSVMFVSSVSTILFNANPLLRYDGYYILSDIMEIPNLRQKASTILNRKLAKWCLGFEEPDDPFLPQRNQGFFALYTVAAVIYRWVVVFSILWFLYKVFEPYGLQILGQMILMLSLVSMVGQPLWKLGKYFSIPGRIQKVKKPRFYATLGIVAAVVAAIAFIPLPYHIVCPFEVKPRDAEVVYVVEPGILEEVYVRPGEKVDEGQPLARLSSPELDIELADIRGNVARLQTQLDTLLQSRFGDSLARLDEERLRASLETMQDQLSRREEDREKLVLKAPRGGVIIPPVSVPERDVPQVLPVWSGTPLQKKNVGAYLETRVEFCRIGDPASLEADLAIEQTEFEFVRMGDPVELQLANLPWDPYKDTEVTGRSDKPMERVSRQLSDKAGGGLLTQTEPDGGERPLNKTFQARAPLDNTSGLISVGMVGRAKIHAAPQTLGQRFWRLVTQTFNFQM